MTTKNLDEFLRDKVKLSPQEAKHFKESGQITSIKKKDFFVQERQIALFKGYLISGCVRVFYTDDRSKENIIYFAFEGAWLGDIESYHLHRPSRVSIQAIEDCELLVYPKTTFHRLGEKIPKIKRWYEFTAVNMYSHLFDKLIESKIRNVEDKYHFLLDEYPEIFRRVPLQYIADYLEIAPQSLSRLRKRLMNK